MVDEPSERLWDQAMIALDSLRGYARIDWAFVAGTAPPDTRLAECGAAIVSIARPNTL
jgi:hypothetical protein